MTMSGNSAAIQSAHQASSASKDQLTIITHAVLVGLTPLIPIPILDDLVKGYFYRSLVKSAATLHGLSLSPGEIAALAEERNAGCLNGCAFWLFETLVKRLVRKVFFVLEWRRSIDLATHTYYYGYLLNHAFRQSWYVPGDPDRAAGLRDAIEQARRGANTHLLRRIITTSFNESRQLVSGVVQQISDSLKDIAFRRSRIWLRRALAVRLRQRAPRLARRLYRLFRPTEQERELLQRTESEVDERLSRESPRLQDALGSLVARLQAGIAGLPEDHFDGMLNALARSLKAA